MNAPPRETDAERERRAIGFFGDYVVDLQRRHGETRALVARLACFHHHPIERERLERRLRDERSILDAVAFSNVVGYGLRSVRLRPEA